MLKRTVSLRRFFWVPTTYVLVDKQENLHFITHSYLEAWNTLRYNYYIQPLLVHIEYFMSFEC